MPSGGGALPLPVHRHLDQGQKLGCILDLVDQYGRLKALQEQGRIGLGRLAKCGVVQRGVATVFSGQPLQARGLADLPGPGEEDHGELVRGGPAAFAHRPGVVMRRLDVERRHILVVPLHVFLGELGNGDTALIGVSDYIIFYIRNILDVSDFITAELEVAPYHFGEEITHGMTDMGIIIRVYTADIHLYLSTLRNKLLFLTGQTVEDLHYFSPVINATA